MARDNTIGPLGKKHGWDRDYPVFDDFDLPSFVGMPSYAKLPYVPDGDELAKRRADIAIVGAPFDDGTSHRPGARFRTTCDPTGHAPCWIRAIAATRHG